MARRSPLHHRIGLYLGLGSLDSALPLILTPAYAHILSVAEFGLLGLLLAFERFFIIVLDCGLTSGAVLTYYERRRAGDPLLTGPILVSYFQRLALVASSIVFLAVALGLLGYDMLFPQSSTVVLAFGVILLSAMLQRNNMLAAATYRAQENVRSFAVLSGGRSIAMVLFTLLIVFVFQWGLFGILLTRTFVYGATAACELRDNIRPRLAGEDNRRAWQFVRRAARRLSLPMLPSELMRWGRTRGNRAVLASTFDLATLGIFNVVTTPGAALTMAATALDRAIEPFFFRTARTDRPEDQALLRHTGAATLSVLAGISAPIMVFAPEFFRLLFPRPYLQACVYTPFAIAALFVANTQSLSFKALQAYGGVKFVPIISGISAVFGLGWTYVLAQMFGLLGAVIGMAIMSLSGSLMAWYMTVRLYNDNAFPRFEAVGLTVLLMAVGTYALVDGGHWMALDGLTLRIPLLAAMLGLIAACFWKRHGMFVARVRQAIKTDKEEGGGRGRGRRDRAVTLREEETAAGG